METAIRWSPHSTAQRPYFVILDVVKSRIDFCEAVFSKSQSSNGGTKVELRLLRHRDKLPSYTAFDFSKVDPYIVGLGGDSGETSIVSLHPEKTKNSEPVSTFTVKTQRRCNSIAFSLNNHIATGLDRGRTDSGLYVFDLNSPANPSTARPVRTWSNGEGISSIKFFSREPDLLLAGVQKQSIRLYDLRDSSSNPLQFYTQARLVHNLAIDPLDENYFISAAPDKESVVGVWDRRMLRSSTTPGEGGPPGAVMEIRSAIDNSHNSSIFSLRFSGLKRGCFGVLSSSGEVRVFELAQHRADSDREAIPQNPNGGTAWQSKTYTRRTHTLAYPPWHPMAVRDDNDRVVACDFIAAPGLTRNLSMLSLHRNRKIKVLDVHTVPRIVNVTALDEIFLWKTRRQEFKPQPDFDTSSEELEALQRKAKIGGIRTISDQSMQSSVLANLSLDGLGSKTSSSFDTPVSISSGDRHEELLMMNFPTYIPELSNALKLLPIQRRRCEEGYSLDAEKNQRIVTSDPWLADMWETINRLDEFTFKDGMYFEGLDLSYLGVYAVWTAEFGTRNRLPNRTTFQRYEFEDAIESIVHRKNYPAFKGHQTQRPSARQLCLAICGWTFSREVLQTRCSKLMNHGQYYKAIVIAVMRGFKDLAQQVLKESIQKKVIHNIGLGAVIACEVVSDEQREMCQWMADETDDPYLKALLAYFVSGDWKVVCDMPILPLSDRLGCAIKYLDDRRLDEFIRVNEASSCISGNIEGLVLTGLTDRAVDLFGRYIARHGDLQTAILALSFSCPVFVADPRFDAWRDTYLLQMQTWRAFHQRALYLGAHSRRSSARASKGERYGDTPSRPVTLRCSHCLSVLAPHTLKKDAQATQVLSQAGIPLAANSASQLIETVVQPGAEFARRPAARSGLVCPRCGRAMPHCGICGLLLGAADPARVRTMTMNSASSGGPVNHSGGAGPAANGGVTAMSLLNEQDLIASQALYCMECLHVFHGHHAREWFARQRVCPVPDCECMCGVLH
jgi:WD repeat-containing protein mio